LPEIEKMVPQLTLEEKAALCSGISSWETTPINRLQIPSVMMADGPHGLRIEREESQRHVQRKLPRHLFPSRGDPGLYLGS
jgi:beta-glucosidase